MHAPSPRLKIHWLEKKQIIFEFQVSGGLRYKDHVEVVTFGSLTLILGHLRSELGSGEKQFFRRLFGKTRVKLDFMDDMANWYRCHAAFILPVAYLAYAHQCNLRICSYRDAKNYIVAGAEDYDFLKSIGALIRPKNDDRGLRGLSGVLLAFSLWVLAKTKYGELAVSNHCRNAVSEMQFMERKFQEIRGKGPSFPMPTFDQLKKEAPDWEELHRLCGPRKDNR